MPTRHAAPARGRRQFRAAESLLMARRRRRVGHCLRRQPRCRCDPESSDRRDDSKHANGERREQPAVRPVNRVPAALRQPIDRLGLREQVPSGDLLWLSELTRRNSVVENFHPPARETRAECRIGPWSIRRPALNHPHIPRLEDRSHSLTGEATERVPDEPLLTEALDPNLDPHGFATRRPELRSFAARSDPASVGANGPAWSTRHPGSQPTMRPPCE